MKKFISWSPLRRSHAWQASRPPRPAWSATRRSTCQVTVTASPQAPSASGINVLTHNYNVTLNPCDGRSGHRHVRRPNGPYSGTRRSPAVRQRVRSAQGDAHPTASTYRCNAPLNDCGDDSELTPVVPWAIEFKVSKTIFANANLHESRSSTSAPWAAAPTRATRHRDADQQVTRGRSDSPPGWLQLIRHRLPGLVLGSSAYRPARQLADSSLV